MVPCCSSLLLEVLLSKVALAGAPCLCSEKALVATSPDGMALKAIRGALLAQQHMVAYRTKVNAVPGGVLEGVLT